MTTYVDASVRLAPLEKLAAGRNLLLKKLPWLRPALITLIPELTNDDKVCPTMFVTPRAMLVINEKFLSKLTAAKTATLLAHEVNHILRGTFSRGDELNVYRSKRTAFLWNIACDIPINDWLRANGFGFVTYAELGDAAPPPAMQLDNPDGTAAVFSTTYGFQPNLTTEQYYDLLQQHPLYKDAATFDKALQSALDALNAFAPVLQRPNPSSSDQSVEDTDDASASEECEHDHSDECEHGEQSDSDAESDAFAPVQSAMAYDLIEKGWTISKAGRRTVLTAPDSSESWAQAADVRLNVGDRVLVPLGLSPDSAPFNGIYEVTTVGTVSTGSFTTLMRAQDCWRSIDLCVFGQPGAHGKTVECSVGVLSGRRFTVTAVPDKLDVDPFTWALSQPQQGQGSNQSGQPKPGACASGGCTGGHLGDDSPFGPGGQQQSEGRSAVDIERMAKQTAEELLQHAQSDSAGSVPGDLLLWAKELVKPPVIKWQLKLAQATSRELEIVRGFHETSYDHFSRRQSGMGYGPGRPVMGRLISPVPKVVGVIDTSGSMLMEGALDRAVSEFLALVRRLQTPVQFIANDAADNGIHTIKDPRDIKKYLVGGGGTDFRPVFEKLSERKHRPHLAVVFTDGCGPAPDKRPPFRLIWVITGRYGSKPYTANGPVTYGRFIFINEDRVTHTEGRE